MDKKLFKSILLLITYTVVLVMVLSRLPGLPSIIPLKL